MITVFSFCAGTCIYYLIKVKKYRRMVGKDQIDLEDMEQMLMSAMEEPENRTHKKE